MIIALSGGMGVGKSTAVDIIRKYYSNYKVVVVKFAQPLYDMQEYIYERIDQVHQRPASFVKDRKLLQWLGTEWGRESISPTLWVDLWKARVKSYPANYVVICDDCRFENEAEAVKSLGGIVVKITAAHAKDRITTANGIAAHASEAGLPDRLIDFHIDNSGTLAQYEEALYRVLGDPTPYEAA